MCTVHEPQWEMQVSLPDVGFLAAGQRALLRPLSLLSS